MKYAVILVLLATSTVCPAQLLVDAEDEVAIGGIRQFITIQASDTTHPVLLFLHGGPGGSVMHYASRFSHRLREHFIVVHWDQRETGKTLKRNASPQPLTLELFQNDTREMVQTLLERFHQDKLFLVGHSWGTALGFYMVRHHPGMLHAFVGIGPMIHQLESEEMALARMKELATLNENRQALEELAHVRIPFETGEQLYYHRKWLQVYAGNTRGLSRRYVERWADTWLDVFNQASRDNLLESLPVVKCPVYLLVGKRDYQTNARLAEKYYNALTAPRKGLYWFDAGHAIPAADPKHLQDVLIGTILPAVYPAAF